MELEAEHRGDPSWPGEDAARRLFADVRTACAGSGGLPARLEATLRLTLETFAADPDVARLLTVDPCPQGEEPAPPGLSGRGVAAILRPACPGTTRIDGQRPCRPLLTALDIDGVIDGPLG